MTGAGLRYSLALASITDIINLIPKSSLYTTGVRGVGDAELIERVKTAPENGGEGCVEDVAVCGVEEPLPSSIPMGAERSDMIDAIEGC